MHTIVRRGLPLAAAAGLLALTGGAGTASAADTAGAHGRTAGDEGIGTGDVLQGAADDPITACGDTGALLAAGTPAKEAGCGETLDRSTVDAATTEDGGAASGDVVGAAANLPTQLCSIAAEAAGAGSGAGDDSCLTFGQSAAAVGTTRGADGFGAGNVLQLAENAPVAGCGDAAGAGAFGSGAKDAVCAMVDLPDDQG